MSVYVLQVKTGEESVVRDKLISKGYIVYVPEEQRLIHTNGKWIQKRYIIFSGYVFISCNFNAQTYYLVKDIPCVIKWLGANPTVPSPLTYLEAEWIGVLAFNGMPLTPSKIKIGEDGKALLIDGILKYFEGRIKKLDKHSKRATVEITVADEKKQIQLSVEIIEQ